MKPITTATARPSARSIATTTARRRAGQRGSTLIEFAICSTLLILLTVGITDFSRMFTVADMAAGASAAGTQYGALSPAHWSDFTGMQNAALLDTGNATGVAATATNVCVCSIGGSSVTCDPSSCGGTTPLKYVSVAVTVTFTSVFSYPWMPNLPSFTTTSMVRVQ